MSNEQISSGTIIGNRYVIDRVIGKGGMAVVYLAIDQQNNQRVAVKVMIDDLANDSEFIRRFANEARSAAALDHPNIVRVLDYGHADGVRFIVQEYVEGKTLKELIEEYKRLPASLAIPLMIQISLALEHAHSRGVIHRDMKASNVLVAKDMTAKVADFGVARATSNNTITMTGGSTIGSVHYFSPEQARGGDTTNRSDLYSLGIMLYEMVTGKLPFEGDNSVSVAIKHLQDIPPLPSTIAPNILPGMDQIIFKSIYKRPEGRYQSAREFIEELDAFSNNPNGIYGLAAQVEADDYGSELGIVKGDTGYSKIRSLEKNIRKSKNAKIRDIVLICAISLLVLSLVVVGSVWIYRSYVDTTNNKDISVVTLQNYVGQDFTKIRDELTKLGITVGDPEMVAKDDVVAGSIIAQYPSEGTDVKPNGTPVVFKVARSSEMIVIPDFSNYTLANAKDSLERIYGLKVIVAKEKAETVAKDIVIRTSPSANEKVAKNSEITIYVSEGASSFKMSKLVGMTWQNALAELKRLQLQLGQEINIGSEQVDADKRFVLKQSVDPDKTVKLNDRIDLTYGSKQDFDNFLNPTPTPLPEQTMPRLIGHTIPEAAKILSAMGVKLSNVSKAQITNSGKIPDDQQYVIKQSVAPGTTFNIAGTILLTYGTEDDFNHFFNPTPAPNPGKP